MELHLKPETEAKLNDLARRTHRGADELLGQAVDYLVEYNEWFERKVSESIAASEKTKAIPDEEIRAWLETAGTPLNADRVVSERRFGSKINL